MNEELAGIRLALASQLELLEQARAAGAPVGALDELVDAWVTAGFSADGVADLLAARCTTPDAARLLGALHVDLAAAAAPARAGELEDTLGFLVAAGLITEPREILQAAGVATLLVDHPTLLALEQGEAHARALAHEAVGRLEELRDLLDSQVLPITVNDLTHQLLLGLGYTAGALDRLGERSIRPMADYLHYVPGHPTTPDRHGAHELAAALRSVAAELEELGQHATTQLYRGDFTPAGFAIRIATTDGQRLGDFLDHHHERIP